jgi:DNA-binding transcriptional MocR family regulator
MLKIGRSEGEQSSMAATATTGTGTGAGGGATAAQETILFTRGVPAAEALPAEQLAECFAAVVTRDPVGVLQYGNPAGYAPLRKLLAEQAGVAEEQVFVTNGSLQLMDLLAALLVKPGGTVLVEQPSYDRAILTFRRRGAKVIGIPLEGDGLDVDRLEAQLKRQVPAFLYTIPDFQNPSGSTLSAAKREQVVALAEQYGFYILEDVPYRTLRYRGEAPPMLRDLNLTRVLTMSSYSKLVAPALRVGHIVAPAQIAAGLARLGEDTYLSPVHPAQAMLYEYLRRGWLGPNVERLKALYAPRRQAMVDAICKHLPEVRFTEPEGGFFLSITFPPEAHTEGLLDRAKREGLLLTDGRAFFADPDQPGVREAPEASRFIRLPFCALTPDQIDEGMRRLARAVGS